ncbi:MAG: DUF4878 domain-containing protein [Thermoleophilaceae bacterium]|jgi:hypothetical protein|nr:DUF4878 domain-containing protein [Thermoleophilaceae bacterium]
MEGAREAAEGYVQALKDGDGEAACELLSRGAIDELEDQTDGECADSLGALFGAVEGASEDLERLEVTDVNVAGRVATATIAGGPGGKVTKELAKEGDDWKLTSPIGG